MQIRVKRLRVQFNSLAPGLGAITLFSNSLWQALTRPVAGKCRHRGGYRCRAHLSRLAGKALAADELTMHSGFS